MFSREDYFHSMLMSFEKFINRLMPYAVLTIFCVGIIRIFLTSFVYLGFFDLTISFLVGIIWLFREKIKSKVKVYILSFLLALMAFVLFNQYGIDNSIGIIILMMSGILILVFATKKQYQITIFVNVLLLIALYMLQRYMLVLSVHEGRLYLLHIVFYLGFMQIIYSAMLSIKKYIAKNLVNLNKQLIENEAIMKELAIQNAEIKMHEKEIYNLAFYDQLTNLPKRNLIERYVSSRLEYVENGIFILVDLKGFKTINTVYGAKFGDQILQIIGEVTTNAQEDEFYFSRINGNEFGIWIEHKSMDEIRNILNKFDTKLKNEMNALLKHATLKFHTAYSIYPKDSQVFDDLYNKANIALNYGKANHLEGLIAYESFMEDKLLYENQFKTLLEDAISKKAFGLHYQEKYDSKNKCVIGLEALARWESSVLGTVAPNEFIPMISKYEMLETFEQMIIEFVFSDIKIIHQKYGHIKVGINISPDHLISSTFVPFIMKMTAKYEVDPKYIIFEITEEVMINGIKVVEELLNEIRNLGYKISLDDFGSGYSSLNYLARLPFDEIKIDKGFVDEINNEKVQKVLETVIELKQIYQVDVIAEGVEDQEQLKCLQSIGCYTIQGYYYSQPSPLSKLVF